MKQTKVIYKENASYGKNEHTVSFYERDSLVEPALEMTEFRRKVVVFICAWTIILEGINLSLPGPFFPKEADNKGMYFGASLHFAIRRNYSKSFKPFFYW